jgi:hypothetical protein
MHDSGDAHKMKVEMFHKRQKEEKLHGARDEKDLKYQLAAIERAARESLRNDAVESNGIFYQVILSYSYISHLVLNL